MTGKRDLTRRVERLEDHAPTGNDLDIDPDVEISDEELDALAEVAAKRLAGDEGYDLDAYHDLLNYPENADPD